jgi:hypothetical protein
MREEVESALLDRLVASFVVLTMDNSDSLCPNNCFVKVQTSDNILVLDHGEQSKGNNPYMRSADSSGSERSHAILVLHC